MGRIVVKLAIKGESVCYGHKILHKIIPECSHALA